jgi:hypothetical protein
MVMKKEYLFLIISLLFLSCHKDGKSVINRNKKDISKNDGLLMIILPSEEKGKVENVGEKKLYSSGAEFLVSLMNLDNYTDYNVIWKIENNFDVGTTIDNGILTVAPKDHGRTITIKAFLEKTNIQGSTTVEVVYFLPSLIYGSWVLQREAYKVIFITSYDTFEIIKNTFIPDNPNIPFYYKTSIQYWYIADYIWGTSNYPVGYSISTIITETNGGSSEVGDQLTNSFYINLDKNAFIQGGGPSHLPDETSFYLKQILP